MFFIMCFRNVLGGVVLVVCSGNVLGEGVFVLYVASWSMRSTAIFV